MDGGWDKHCHRRHGAVHDDFANGTDSQDLPPAHLHLASSEPESAIDYLISDLVPHSANLTWSGGGYGGPNARHTDPVVAGRAVK
jgi:hypothetical protein